MKLFSNLSDKQNVGYSRFQLPSKDTSSIPGLGLVTHIFGIIFAQAVNYSTYLLLPVTLLFYIPQVHVFHFNYFIIPIEIILFLALLYKMQDRLLYHPEVPPNATLHVALPTHVPHEVVSLRTVDNETLHGFFIKKSAEDRSTSPTIIYFHGNAGNAGSPCALPLSILCGCNVLVVDYRGYGKSSGHPSEEGLYVDGKTCIEYLLSRADVDPNKIILFGHSMGGAVAILLAAMANDEDYRIAALIVENTFTSIPDAAKHIFRGAVPGISKLPQVCFKNKFLSVEKIANVTVPILFICGEKDEILNPNMMKTLLRVSNNPHTAMLRVPNGSHNDTWCVSRTYHRCVSAFLAKVFNEDIQRTTVDAYNVDETISKDKPISELVLTWKCEVVAE